MQDDRNIYIKFLIFEKGIGVHFIIFSHPSQHYNILNSSQCLVIKSDIFFPSGIFMLISTYVMAGKALVLDVPRDIANTPEMKTPHDHTVVQCTMFP